MKTWKKSNPDKFGSSTEGQLHKLGLNITGRHHKFLASNVGQFLKLSFSIAGWLHKFVASSADLIHQDLLPAWWPAPGSCPKLLSLTNKPRSQRKKKIFTLDSLTMSGSHGVQKSGTWLDLHPHFAIIITPSLKTEYLLNTSSAPYIRLPDPLIPSPVCK